MKDWAVFLDDERWPPDSLRNMYGRDLVICRSQFDLELHIDHEFECCPGFITFDHDLGADQPTGYDIAKWLIERDMDAGGRFIPDDFIFTTHSQNPVGARNIRMLLQAYLDQRIPASDPPKE